MVVDCGSPNWDTNDCEWLPLLRTHTGSQHKLRYFLHLNLKLPSSLSFDKTRVLQIRHATYIINYNSRLCQQQHKNPIIYATQRPIAPKTMNLFGITNDTSLKELQKSYYNFALLCHPDNGGTTEDMQVVQRAYEEAKSQLKQAHASQDKMDSLIDTLEKGTLYENTSQNRASDALPSLRDIFDEVHNQFHSICHNTCPENKEEQEQRDNSHFLECYENDPYASQGYGSYMLERWKSSEQQQNKQPVYTPDVDTTEAPPLPVTTEHDHTQLVKHSVFQASTGYPVQVDSQQHVSDFTVSEDMFANTVAGTDRLPRSDYRQAFAPPAPPPQE